jgi:hypothetical protein
MIGSGADFGSSLVSSVYNSDLSLGIGRFMTLGLGKSFVVTGALFSSEKPLVFGAKVDRL